MPKAAANPAMAVMVGVDHFGIIVLAVGTTHDRISRLSRTNVAAICSSNQLYPPKYGQADGILAYLMTHNKRTEGGFSLKFPGVKASTTSAAWQRGSKGGKIRMPSWNRPEQKG